jgi:putative transposase
MYNWRQMGAEDRVHALDARRARHLPWHSPPHLDLIGTHQYLISAARYEHALIIGKDHQRMSECEESLLAVCRETCLAIHAWCVLPNHYHTLVTTGRIKDLRKLLGRFRKVWFNCFERPMKSSRHFWATLNYIHHNPVHHGYVDAWQDWPWSSASEFLQQVGRERALEIWARYPILDYGKKWDFGGPVETSLRGH